MIHRRKDLPTLDPKMLRLPRTPKVAEIRTSTYQNAVGEEGLEVLVILDALSAREEEDLTWTRPIEERIREALDEGGEERFPLILFRKKQDTELDEDPIGGE